MNGTTGLLKSSVWRVMVVPVLAVVMGVGITLLTQALEGKWLIALIVGLSLFWITLVVRDPACLWLALFAFFLSMDVDVYLGSTDGRAGGGALSLSACDVALLGLYAIWMARLLVSRPEDRRLRVVPSVTLPFGLLLFWSSVSSLQATDPTLALYRLVPMVKVWLAFFYLVNNVHLHEEQQLLSLGIAMCLGTLVQGVLAFAQYFLGVTFGLGVLGETRHSLLLQEMGVSELARVGGTMGHPNALGSFLVTTLPIALVLLLAGRRLWVTVLATLTFVIGLATLVLTFSRGAWVSFALVAPWVMVLGRWKRGGVLKVVKSLGLFGLIVTIVALPFAAPITQRLFEHDYGRAWSRVPQMQVAWNIIRAHPVLGVGLNNYTLVMGSYDNTLEQITLRVSTPVHNMFLLTAAEVGIPGLLFLVWLIIVLLKRGWRGRWDGQSLRGFFCLGLLGALASTLIVGLVEPKHLASKYFMALFMGFLGPSIFYKGPK